jgi:hypothetical protein
MAHPGNKIIPSAFRLFDRAPVLENTTVNSQKDLRECPLKTITRGTRFAFWKRSEVARNFHGGEYVGS